MAKYCGKIGFVKTIDDGHGVWIPKVIEKIYRGDVVTNTRRWDTSANGINDNLNLNNSIIIIADGFALENCSFIKYVEWMGSLWNVTSIDIQRPRLTLTIGGVYNGPKPNKESKASASGNASCSSWV